MPYLVSLICLSHQILVQTQTGVSGQSLIKENCHKSKTSNDTDMELGPVTKLDKRNKTTSKRLDDDVMSTNYDIIVIFPILDQSRAIQKPHSRHIVCKMYISLIVTSFLTKTTNRTKKSLTQPSHYCFE